MISALKKGTATSQTFWGCDDTNTGGVLGVLVDGVLTTGDTLVSENDYCGLVTVSGLSSGSHTYQMVLDGVAVGNSYTFQTHPEAGEEFDVLVIGDALEAENIIDLVTNRESQARCVFGSECSYIEGFVAGEPATGTNAVLDTAAHPTEYAEYLAWYRGGYRSIWSTPRWQRFVNTFPGRYVWNNHEFDSNASDNGTGALSANGQCQYDAAIKAFREYEGAGNPSASDSAYTVDSWPNPVVYFSEVIGDIEFICPDYTSYSATALAYNMGTAGRGEQAQKAWVESVVSASTAKCIVFILPTLAATATNTLEWVDAGVGLLRNGLQVDKPILFVSANTHVPCARGVYRNSGMARAIPEVGVSPIKQSSRADIGFHPEDNPGEWVKHAFMGRDNQTYPATLDSVYSSHDVEWVYGLIKRRSDRTIIQLKRVLDGGVLFEIELTDDMETVFKPRNRAVA